LKNLEQEDVLRIAEAAGLKKAVAQYRDDVLAAAKAAADARSAFPTAENAALEPWPPMRAGGRP
jgi:hypothetical protein